jgi:hypothetical protein
LSVHEASIRRIVESGQRMGIEIDQAEAEAWIAAMESEAIGGDVRLDVDSGVYGHRVTMADYSPADLARFRAMAEVVGIEDRPPTVTTALALSGSAAQGKIQRYPADCDFFERVHIMADTRDEAVAILGDVLREKALATLRGPGFRLWEAKWGTWDEAGTVRGAPVKPGSWIAWAPSEVEAGTITLTRADGSVREVAWADAPGRPGWSKLDWVVGDRERGILANASNVFDPTWEAPDGSIVPLDGFLEPYFQEVYLEAQSIPLFSRLVKQLGGDAVDDYVEQLEAEVRKYAGGDHPNYGKAARRMYNVFRLSGLYAEAAYIRELFDEPVTALYQLAAQLETVDDASEASDTFDREMLITQLDRLIMSAIAALEGSDEAMMVARLSRLRETIAEQAESAQRDEDIAGARAAAMEAVNDYFRRALEAVPSIREYLTELGAGS